MNNQRNPRRPARTRPTGRPTWSWWPSATPRWGAQPPGPVRVTGPVPGRSAGGAGPGPPVRVERSDDPARTSIGRRVAEPDRDRGRVAAASPAGATRSSGWSASPSPWAPPCSPTGTTGCTWWCRTARRRRPARGQGLGRRPHDQREPGLDRWEATFTPVAVGCHRFEVQAWIDPFATWRDATRRKLDAGVDTPGDLLAGAQLLEQLAEVAAKRDAKALRAAADALRRRATPRRSTDDRVGAELEALAQSALRRTDGRLGRDPDRRGRARAGAVLGLVRAVPPVDRRRRPDPASMRRPGRRDAPRPDRRAGATSPTWASTSSTCRRSTRSALRSARAPTTPPTPAPTTPAARGPSAGRRAATPRCTPSSAPSTTWSSWPPRPGRAGSTWPSTSPSSARPTTRGSRSTPSGSGTGPTAPSSTPRTRPRSTRTSTRSTSRAPTGRSLWDALLDVTLFWADHGVRVFRVDNPHTKPFPFWEWLIAEVQQRHPEHDLPGRGVHPAGGHAPPGPGRLHPGLHLLHLARVEAGAHRLLHRAGRRRRRSTSSAPTSGRPPPTSSPGTCSTRRSRRSRCASCWPPRCRRATASRPDLRAGGERAVVLPDGSAGRSWPDPRSTRCATGTWPAARSLRPLLAELNRIRRDQLALHTLRTLRFHGVDNDALLCFSKTAHAGPSVDPDRPEQASMLVVVNLDPHRRRGRARSSSTSAPSASTRPARTRCTTCSAATPTPGRVRAPGSSSTRTGDPAHLFRVTQEPRETAP